MKMMTRDAAKSNVFVQALFSKVMMTFNRYSRDLFELSKSTDAMVDVGVNVV